MISNETNESESKEIRSARGFAVMDRDLQRKIASKGGKAQGKHNNSGNFANNREKAREAGKKGGHSTRGHKSSAIDTDE